MDTPGVHMPYLAGNTATLVAWVSCPYCGLKCAVFISDVVCSEAAAALDHGSFELGEAGA